MKYCPTCKDEYDDTENYCTCCGRELLFVDVSPKDPAFWNVKAEWAYTIVGLIFGYLIAYLWPNNYMSLAILAAISWFGVQHTKGIPKTVKYLIGMFAGIAAHILLM